MFRYVFDIFPRNRISSFVFLPLKPAVCARRHGPWMALGSPVKMAPYGEKSKGSRCRAGAVWGGGRWFGTMSVLHWNRGDVFLYVKQERLGLSLLNYYSACANPGTLVKTQCYFFQRTTIWALPSPKKVPWVLNHSHLSTFHGFHRLSRSSSFGPVTDPHRSCISRARLVWRDRKGVMEPATR